MKKDTDILLRKMAQGDTNALEEIYVAYAPKIRCFISRYLGESEAEDMTHDIFLKLWNGRRKLWRGQLLRIENLDSYMFRTAKNAVLDRMKHLKIEQNYSTAFAAANTEVQEPRQEDAMDSRTKLVAVQKQIESLTEQQRRVFEMHRNEGKTYAEIARDLNISEKTVQYHISTVLHKLRSFS